MDIAREDVFYPKSGDAQSVPYRLGQGVWLRNALFLLKWWDGWVKQNYANVANRSLPPATQPNNGRQRFTLNRWNVTKPGVVSGFCAGKKVIPQNLRNLEKATTKTTQFVWQGL